MARARQGANCNLNDRHIKCSERGAVFFLAWPVVILQRDRKVFRKRRYKSPNGSACKTRWDFQQYALQSAKCNVACCSMLARIRWWNEQINWLHVCKTHNRCNVLHCNWITLQRCAIRATALNHFATVRIAYFNEQMGKKQVSVGRASASDWKKRNWCQKEHFSFQWVAKQSKVDSPMNRHSNV